VWLKLYKLFGYKTHTTGEWELLIISNQKGN
jgi:hypothetical protein